MNTLETSETSVAGPPNPGPRAYTPPALKWLLNERAALAGKAAKLHNQASRHLRQSARYREQMEKAIAIAGERQAALALVRSQMSALTTAIELQFPTVNPSAAGTVNAWKDKYGERGALTLFLKKTLEENPAGMRCSELVKRVCCHFHLIADSALERKRLRSVVRSRLVTSKEFEMVAGSGPKAGQQPVWRLAGRLPSLCVLASLRGRCNDPDQNPGHREMAAQ